MIEYTGNTIFTTEYQDTAIADDRKGFEQGLAPCPFLLMLVYAIIPAHGTAFFIGIFIKLWYTDDGNDIVKGA
jgi:hypothetical protein